MGEARYSTVWRGGKNVVIDNQDGAEVGSFENFEQADEYRLGLEKEFSDADE